MKKLLAILFFLPAVSWASFQPVTGSTITVFPTQGGTLPVSGTVTANEGVPSSDFHGVDFSTGVQVNTGGRFLSIELSTGVSANQGSGNADFWGLDLSTGVRVSNAQITVVSTGIPVINPVTVISTGIPSYQLNTWSVSPGTGTYPVAIIGGSISNTSFQATQPVDATLNASVSIKGSSNTVSSAQSGTWSVSPGTGTYPVAIQGTIQTTPGPISIIAINGSTTSVSYQGTVSSVPVNVMNATLASTQSGTWSVSPGTGTYPVAVLNTAFGVTGGVTVVSTGVPAFQSGAWSVSPGTGTYPVAVLNTAFGVTGPVTVVSTGIPLGTVTATAVAYTTAAFTAAFPPVGAAIAFTGPTGLTQAGRVDVSSNVLVAGTAASGAAASGNPVEIGVRVTSSTIPTAASDGQTIYQAATNIGQQLVTGVPFGITLSTYTTNIASATVGTGTTGEMVLISSGGAATYAYLCGCVFTNTTATNGAVVIESPKGNVSNRITIGIPANYVPSGIWPGCTNPLFRSLPNADIAIYQTIASTSQSVYGQCRYYLGP